MNSSVVILLAWFVGEPTSMLQWKNLDGTMESCVEKVYQLNEGQNIKVVNSFEDRYNPYTRVYLQNNKTFFMCKLIDY